MSNLITKDNKLLVSGNNLASSLSVNNFEGLAHNCPPGFCVDMSSVPDITPEFRMLADLTSVGAGDWYTALAYVNKMNIDGVGGMTNWRLPTKAELVSLVSVAGAGDYFNPIPVDVILSNPLFTGVSGADYWSGELDAESTGWGYGNRPWVVNLGQGLVEPIYAAPAGAGIFPVHDLYPEVFAYEENEFTWSDVGGVAYITGYSGGIDVRVPETLGGMPVGGISTSAFPNIVSITLPSGVSYIAEDAFGSSSIINIVLGGNVTIQSQSSSYLMGLFKVYYDGANKAAGRYYWNGVTYNWERVMLQAF